MSIGMSLSTIPPVRPFMGLGRWCFLTRLTPSTTRCLASTIRSTVPRFPLSLPVVTMTSSPFLIFSIVLPVSRGRSSQYFGRERNDLHEALAAKFPGHRPEDARADGLHLGCKEHCGVRVEPDAAAVGAAHAEGRAHHHGVVNLAFLDAAARRRVLDAHPDDVANVGVAAFRAAQHLDTHHSTRASVIGDIEHRLHLNHFSVSNLSGPNALRAGSFGSRPGREKAANSTRNQNLCQDKSAYAARAFSISLAIRHALVLEIGRHSSITTKSPSPHSFFSSWAWYFFERVTIFPYIGWVTRRSTSTVTVLSILSLTTRPVSVRVVLASLISLPPFPSGWCAPARCRGARFSAGCCW